jgi:two-component sensor histidine kinase
LFIESNWEASSLHDVVDTALAPYRSGDAHLVVNGPKVSIGSKQALSLALALHELATNATKYGALSQPGGQIDIAWSIDDTDRKPRFTFSWQETGGPPVSAPEKKGFGTVLISRALKADFAGAVDVTYDKAGLQCRLTTDVENLAPAFQHPAG